MASERAAALADDFARANAEAVDFVRGCDDDAWVRPVPREGWTVGVVLHHIGESYADSSRWLREMARGDGVTETAAMIDEANAAHAARAASVTPAETLALLCDGGAGLEDALRACSDEELDRRAPFGPAGGRLVPTVELAAVPARHTREHLSHARQAVSA